MKNALLIFLFSFIFKISANGGPVAWTNITPLGGIRLKSVSDVILVNENLKIDLLNDFNSYKVNALYELEKKGVEGKILFGVPITWYEDDDDYMIEISKEKTKKSRLKTISKIAKNIKIKINDTEVNCRAASIDDISVFSDSYPEESKIKNWCVSELFFKKGKNSLSLKYKASLIYIDSSFSSSALTTFGDRKLVYEFFPAGYWKGSLNELNVKINLGVYKNLIKLVSIKEFKKKNGKLTLSLRDVDFKKLKQLELVFNSGNALRKKEMTEWNRNAQKYQKIKLVAKSSSHLDEYEVQNILDGNRNTAWCEGVKGVGVNEWIEIRPKGDYFSIGKYCQLEGFVIVPGYIKSQNTYLSNARVKKIGISDCKGDNIVEYSIPVSKNYRDAPLLIKNEIKKAKWEKFIKSYRSNYGNDYTRPEYQQYSPKPQLDFIIGSNCARLKILEVEKGKVEDTCISELSLVTNCG